MVLPKPNPEDTEMSTPATEIIDIEINANLTEAQQKALYRIFGNAVETFNDSPARRLHFDTSLIRGARQDDADRFDFQLYRSDDLPSHFWVGEFKRGDQHLKVNGIFI